jgi:hypothetical protein
MGKGKNEYPIRHTDGGQELGNADGRLTGLFFTTEDTFSKVKSRF